mmetsp:Transcript_20732/g.30537  ORF Transcript_20732/g.30537 Transcript_20732/m.30537 type:complete len:84 (+) Transcript_20732:1315-1566(+)
MWKRRRAEKKREVHVIQSSNLNRFDILQLISLIISLETNECVLFSVVYLYDDGKDVDGKENLVPVGVTTMSRMFLVKDFKKFG